MDPHPAALGITVELLELGEPLRQAPVVAQVDEERVDALRRLLELRAGRDQAGKVTTTSASPATPTRGNRRGAP
jgi:hypothetical protein